MNDNQVSRSEFEDLRKRVAESEARLNRGDTTLALINQRLESIEARLSEMSVDLRTLREKPAKRWESVVSQVLSWIVALLLGFIAVKIA